MELFSNQPKRSTLSANIKEVPTHLSPDHVAFCAISIDNENRVEKGWNLNVVLQLTETISRRVKKLASDCESSARRVEIPLLYCFLRYFRAFFVRFSFFSLPQQVAIARVSV